MSLVEALVVIRLNKQRMPSSDESSGKVFDEFKRHLTRTLFALLSVPFIDSRGLIKYMFLSANTMNVHVV